MDSIWSTGRINQQGLAYQCRQPALNKLVKVTKSDAIISIF